MLKGLALITHQLTWPLIVTSSFTAMYRTDTWFT